MGCSRTRGRWIVWMGTWALWHDNQRERWVWIRRALVKYLSNFSCSRQVVRSFERTQIFSHFIPLSRTHHGDEPAIPQLSRFTQSDESERWWKTKNRKSAINFTFHARSCSVAWELTESLSDTGCSEWIKLEISQTWNSAASISWRREQKLPRKTI